LKNLIYNETFCRKVLPFVKAEYFADDTERVIFREVNTFVNTYKSLPTHEALVINFTESDRLTEPQVRNSIALLNDIHQNKDEPTEEQWLIEQTEKFCQDKAIYNAIMESVSIMDDKTSKKSKGEIPQLLSDALGVSFDANVGHDYINDADSRYDFYHRVESRIRFDLDIFNKITKGGMPTKTLNICLAGTGVGKSLFMCHVAASCISNGHNVLYITLEMAEERIAERIDANLLNIDIQELNTISKADYDRKFNALKNKTQGKLIIKEYPTAAASTLHFRALLQELHLKKNFKPEIIFIDYLNICSSARMKPGNSVNSYTYIKAIAEELRGLAVEFAVPIVSATQTTRSGFTNSDPGLEDTSESFGLPATADFMFALISTEELEQLGQIMVKQLKNRYSDPNTFKRFVVGIDRGKMKLFDAEADAQTNIADSGQEIPDKPINTFGNREKRFNSKFEGVRV
jgi:replicative DNA helicase|tara:strand:+ start:6932 stop:8311 length:1380 start_codon:yes stop_codon:yes gene_type:complete